MEFILGKLTLLFSIYLPFILLFILLSEDSVDPPNLGKHAAICKAETKTQQPQAELAEKKEMIDFIIKLINKS